MKKLFAVAYQIRESFAGGFNIKSFAGWVISSNRHEASGKAMEMLKRDFPPSRTIDGHSVACVEIPLSVMYEVAKSSLEK